MSVYWLGTQTWIVMIEVCRAPGWRTAWRAATPSKLVVVAANCP